MARNALRPHQRQAVADVVAALADADRCQYVSACGTGKTFTCQRIADRIAPDGLVVVAVPTIALVAQTVASWRQMAARGRRIGVDVDYLAVCSAVDVEARGDDTAFVDADPQHATTDPVAVKQWLVDLDGPGALFTTHASAGTVADALEAAAVEVDLLVVDEAHRAAGAGQLGEIVCGRLPARRRLFATATPRVFKPGPEGAEEALSMADDPAGPFGAVAHRLTFADAIERDLIVPYEIVVQETVSPETAEQVRKGSAAERAATHTGVVAAASELGLHRLLSFHSTVARAETFATKLPPDTAARFGDVRLHVDSVTAKHGAGERAGKFARLATVDHGQADLAVLANVRVCSEGVDIPAIDGVVFVDPRSSVVDVTQAVGRAMRKAPGKTRGYVIVPLVVPADGNVDEHMRTAGCGQLWNVLAALQSVDDRLADLLVQAARRPAGAQRCSDCGRILAGDGHECSDSPDDKGPWIDVFGDDIEHALPADRFAELLDTIARRIISSSVSSFEVGLAHLREYVEEHGDALVPADRRSSDGYPLGQWVSDRRRARQGGRGRNTVEQIAALDALGFIWSISDEAFEVGLAHLREYVAENGDARVPRKHVAEDGYRLGQWAASRRQARKGTTRGRITVEQIAALDALGFVWGVGDEAFEVGLAHLREYVGENGNARVQQDHISSDGYPLGQWVSDRRRARQGGSGRNTVEQIAALDALGFIWSISDEVFEVGLAHLREYVAENRNACVPNRHLSPDGFRLGGWVFDRRKARKGKRGHRITAEQIATLDALGFVWDPRKK